MAFNVLIIIQSRYNSKRLPGKVLLPLDGKPVLSHVFDRANMIKSNYPILCAIGKDKNYKKITKLCESSNINYYVGPTRNVLKRYYAAYKHFNKNIKFVMRITSDCPLIDPYLCNELIKYTIENDLDYASNVSKPLFPQGLDCEVFKFSKLEDAFYNAKYNFEKEHVTQYIRNNTNNYCGSIKCPHLGLENLRWTIDTVDDYKVLKEIFLNFKKLINENKYFPLAKAILNSKKNIYFSNFQNRYKGLIDSVKKEKYIEDTALDKRIKKQFI